MESFILTVLICVLLYHWLMTRGRLQRVEAQVAELTRRVFWLEKERRVEPARPSAAPEAKPVAQSKESEPTPVAEQPVFTPMFEPEIRPLPSRVPRPTAGERVKTLFGEQEWEALLGGSLLNKIGALVLVIGIALFLGYSFTYMNPAGRALTSLGTSVCLLAGGVYLERKETYRVFASGLIGAGWAALYVTAYAMYALPAARLIHDPFTGSLLLSAVAGGMIAHSLKYHLQAITAVAYFAAFAALGVTPASTFGLLSLIPLSASLLYLAHRFRWHQIALFGVAATYATCVWRGDSGASLAASQSLLLVYWLLFEAFDLLRVRSRATDYGLALVFPLNAIAFLWLSYRAWWTDRPEYIWQGCALAAALYLGSAVIRFVLLRPSTFTEGEHVVDRMRSGSYEAPATLAALLAGLSIATRLIGTWLGVGLAVEAEVIYLAGVFLDLAFLRWLGNFGFFISFLRLLSSDVVSGRVLTLSNGRVIHAWTPAAVFQAALYYVNRVLRPSNVVHSCAAALLIAGVLGQELPSHYAGTGWIAFAALLFEIGLHKRPSEIRLQAYVLAGCGVSASLFFDATVPMGWSLGLLCAMVLRLRFAAALAVEEGRWFDACTGAAITALSMLVAWQAAPAHYEGLSCCVLALVLFEFGARRLPATLRQFSCLAMTAAAAAVVMELSYFAVRPAPYFVLMSYAGAALCLSFFSERAKSVHPVVRAAASSIALGFTLYTLWLVLPAVAVAPAWACLAVALFTLGLRRQLEFEKWQSYAIMLASVFNAWMEGFHAAGMVIVCACYVAQFLTPKDERLTRARVFWSVLGTFALTVLLAKQFPGGPLTVAWGIEGLALLAAGFPLRERVLRLSGLAMLLVCILKLFLYDLRNLETVYRILSFVALGLILLGVSSIYTRFRERVKQYL